VTITRRQADDESSKTKPQPNERSAKLILLKTCLVLFGVDLTEEAFNYWLMFMDGYSVTELRYAFDNWSRNSKFSPKPKDIGDLVAAYQISHETQFRPCGKCEAGWLRVPNKRADNFYGKDGHTMVTRCQCWLSWRGNIERMPEVTDPCSAACRNRHGKGYHTDDIAWLLKRYVGKKDSLPNRPMTDSEIDKLLEELDKHRGRKPAWKVA
jgi:hypothetical protein